VALLNGKVVRCLGLETFEAARFAWVVFPLLFSDPISGRVLNMFLTWVKMNDFLCSLQSRNLGSFASMGLIGLVVLIFG
jgi:hypothetical protein